MTGVSVVRAALAMLGIVLLVSGIGLAISGVGVPVSWFFVLELVIGGMVLIVVSAVEITRYRSEAADRTRADAGPGGGEPAAPEPRFRPTDETFVDPTTKRTMRVFADRRTGERRYVAEP